MRGGDVNASGMRGRWGFEWRELQEVCIRIAGRIALLSAPAVGGEWDVAQPALSIGVDRWPGGEGAPPQGSAGGFITPCAAPELDFLQPECGKTRRKASSVHGHDL